MKFSPMNATGRNESVTYEPGEVPKPSTYEVNKAKERVPVIPENPIEAAKKRLELLKKLKTGGK